MKSYSDFWLAKIHSTQEGESTCFKRLFTLSEYRRPFLCSALDHVINPYLLRSPLLSEFASRIFLPGTTLSNCCHGREDGTVSPSQTIQFCLLATAPSSFRRIKKRLLFKQTLSPLYITRHKKFKLFHFFENFWKNFYQKSKYTNRIHDNSTISIPN